MTLFRPLPFLPDFHPMTWAILGFTAALVAFDVTWILIRRSKKKRTSELDRKKKGF